MSFKAGRVPIAIDLSAEPSPLRTDGEARGDNEQQQQDARHRVDQGRRGHRDGDEPKEGGEAQGGAGHHGEEGEEAGRVWRAEHMGLGGVVRRTAR